MEARAEIGENQIVIHHKKTPLGIRIFLIVVAVCCAIIPFSVLGFLVSSAKGFHIGVVIGFAFFGWLAFFMLRLFLWNSFGKEVLTFHDDHIHYLADYRYFKDGKKEIPVSGLVIDIFQEEGGYEHLGRMEFQQGETVVRTALPIELAELKTTLEKIKDRYPGQVSPLFFDSPKQV
ncbi:hypothetical protein KFE98_14900 [bacterium SCSIO 12741]|nr:hypothetical protein KFE98_14900 [bacterium SCSIO 12741]